MSKRKGKAHHEEEEAGEAWLLPYSDLMTLLLAVFIVLFAVSQVDIEAAESMAKAFRGNMMEGGVGILKEDGPSVIDKFPLGEIKGEDSEAAETEETDSNQEDASDLVSEQEMTQEEINDLIAQSDLANLEEIQGTLEEYFDEEGIDTSVTTYIDERGLVISLNNAILFDSGSADIKPENKKILVEIAKTVKNLDNYIRIEGHTDDRPIETAVYPSNWELSCARAARVVRLFIDSADIIPEHMVAVGYGEYKPISDNKSVSGRAQNRRIDIIVLNTKYNSLEDQLSDVPQIN